MLGRGDPERLSARAFLPRHINRSLKNCYIFESSYFRSIFLAIPMLMMDPVSEAPICEGKRMEFDDTEWDKCDKTFTGWRKSCLTRTSFEKLEP